MKNDIRKGSLELTIDGKTKQFNNGYDMWKWGNSQTRLETEFDEKKGPFFCDWMERQDPKVDNNKKKNKKK